MQREQHRCVALLDRIEEIKSIHMFNNKYNNNVILIDDL